MRYIQNDRHCFGVSHPQLSRVHFSGISSWNHQGEVFSRRHSSLCQDHLWDPPLGKVWAQPVTSGRCCHYPKRVCKPLRVVKQLLRHRTAVCTHVDNGFSWNTGKVHVQSRHSFSKESCISRISFAHVLLGKTAATDSGGVWRACNWPWAFGEHFKEGTSLNPHNSSIKLVIYCLHFIGSKMEINERLTCSRSHYATCDEAGM